MFGADDSPTRSRLTKELAGKFSAAKFYQYEALTGDAASDALGDGVRMVADFSRADRIVSLDCDFAGTDNQGPVMPFFDRRKPEGKGYDSKPDASTMNRLYAVEAAFTLTGGMADHRLRVSPSQVTAVAAQIARGLGVKAGVAIVSPELSDPKQVAWVNGLVEDLKENAGKSVVLAGSRQPLALHLLAHAINVALGNIGEGKPLLAVQTETKGLGNLTALKADIDSKASKSWSCSHLQIRFTTLPPILSSRNPSPRSRPASIWDFAPTPPRTPRRGTCRPLTIWSPGRMPAAPGAPTPWCSR